MTKETSLRAFRKRDANRPKPSVARQAEQVARVNEVIRTSKTTWFGLLSYLAFVLVTWMGVKDADFFLTERETTLPIIGVAIPTLLFFALAPVIGSLIYSYLHMQLLKLWEALATADPIIDDAPLSDHINPWLVADLCLSYRTDGAMRKRPLAGVSNFINFVIAFWGGPIVLGAVWWASATPHYDWLTILACGLPLIFTFYVGLNGWVHMRQIVKEPNSASNGLPLTHFFIVICLAFAVTLLGWFRVEGTFKNYALLVLDEDQVTDSFLDWEILALLKSADLSGVNFAKTPADWHDRQTFRRQYRNTWCNEVGLPANVCGAAPKLETWRRTKVTQGVELARAKWCTELHDPKTEPLDCTSIFSEYEAQFENAWVEKRQRDIAGLQPFDFESTDLRQANLRDAQLQGADLSHVQLQGADLSGAQLQEADLFSAQLQGAILISAQLQATDLWFAQLQGANLSGAQFDRATTLGGATLRGAAVRGVDFTNVPHITDHLNDVFGDMSTTLPIGVKRPDLWSTEYSFGFDFGFGFGSRSEWLTWQATLPEGWDQ
ncbi:pentapeptide repeat-containing protein [Tateyamaria sp.]|uniref:pentapeptide repeat-containing protein n=1 Tax=Tateyamaria sp. TaxID=1929288 RepID=UPI00329B48B0